MHCNVAHPSLREEPEEGRHLQRTHMSVRYKQTVSAKLTGMVLSGLKLPHGEVCKRQQYGGVQHIHHDFYTSSRSERRGTHIGPLEKSPTPQARLQQVTLQNDMF